MLILVASVGAAAPCGAQDSVALARSGTTAIETGRFGDALQAFLAVPRFGGYARGAAVLIVSDGLERGDPLAMSDAVAKLSRRAWRLNWLTPLAVAKNFKPQTEALMAIARFVDDMVDGGSTTAIVAHVLAMAQGAAA